MPLCLPSTAVQLMAASGPLDVGDFRARNGLLVTEAVEVSGELGAAGLVLLRTDLAFYTGKGFWTGKVISAPAEPLHATGRLSALAWCRRPQQFGPPPTTPT